MSRFLLYIIVAFGFVSIAWGEESVWNIQGRVIDEAGKPVAGAVVDRNWSCNGTKRNPDGMSLDLSKADQLQVFWGHLGKMEPLSKNAAKTEIDGLFKMAIPDIFHVVMAMDKTREHGGLAFLPKGKEEQPIEIKLQPLVRVHGKLECADQSNKPEWTHVYVNLPEDQTRPLDICRIATCGSFESLFEFSLPPGDYVLDAYGISSLKEDDIDLRVTPDPKLIVKSGAKELNMGILQLKKVTQPSFRKRVEQAKDDGSWSDYSKHYGEPPPRWHVTDSRGVNKDVQISDFRGKWVLLAFWGFSCRFCLSEELPKLMKFYEEHKAQREQFEILSICIDYEGDLKSMADVDHALEPIVKHVWGKTLPFPIMLDTTFKTLERFGSGTGTIVLIDPEGNMVEGDETTLAKKLK